MNFVRILRSSTVGGISNWSTLVQLGLGFVTVCGGGSLLTWAASSIDPIMQYGWGASISSGLAAMCCLILFLSIGAAAWRFFSPLPPQLQTKVQSGSGDFLLPSQSALDEFKNHIALLNNRIAANRESISSLQENTAKNILEINHSLATVKDLLKPTKRHLSLLENLGDPKPVPTTVFEGLERDIDRLANRLNGTRDDLVEKIEKTNYQIKSTEQQSKFFYNILSTALRARDALDMLKNYELVAIDKGPKLMRADSYNDDQDWKVGYVEWQKAMQGIDQICRWWIDHHSPFLHITSRDLEGNSYVAPEHIVKNDDGNRVRYKTVWIAQQSYSNRREGVFSYFESKASDLPG